MLNQEKQEIEEPITKGDLFKELINYYFLKKMITIYALMKKIKIPFRLLCQGNNYARYFKQSVKIFTDVWH